MFELSLIDKMNIGACMSIKDALENGVAGTLNGMDILNDVDKETGEMIELAAVKIGDQLICGASKVMCNRIRQLKEIVNASDASVITVKFVPIKCKAGNGVNLEVISVD